MAINRWNMCKYIYHYGSLWYELIGHYTAIQFWKNIRPIRCTTNSHALLTAVRMQRVEWKKIRLVHSLELVNRQWMGRYETSSTHRFTICTFSKLTTAAAEFMPNIKTNCFNVPLLYILGTEKLTASNQQFSHTGQMENFRHICLRFKYWARLICLCIFRPDPAQRRTKFGHCVNSYT